MQSQQCLTPTGHRLVVKLVPFSLARPKIAVLFFLIGLSVCAAAHRASASDHSWSIVVLPDTQNYRTPSTEPIFLEQTQWIVDNKDTFGIEMVLHTGDITEDNLSNQWAVAKAAMGTLDGVVPYMMAYGNHDIAPPFGRSETLLNDFFSLSDNPLNSIVTERIAGDLGNTYSRFVAPDGRKMLIFSLEYQPRTAVMAWAGGIADQYADYTAVVITHSNLQEGPAVNGEPTAFRNPSEGEALWDGLTGQYENIELVLNSHYPDSTDDDPNGPLTTARQSSLGVNGNLVQEIVFNSQQQPNGGNGYLRLMEFVDDGKTVQVRTYSPSLDVWLTNDRNEFQFELTPLSTVVPEPSSLAMLLIGSVGALMFRRR